MPPPWAQPDVPHLLGACPGLELQNYSSLYCCPRKTVISVGVSDVVLHGAPANRLQITNTLQIELLNMEAAGPKESQPKSASSPVRRFLA